MLLSDLPLDLLLDSLFPLLPLLSLLSLSAANRNFRQLITGDLSEPLWRDRLVHELNFPADSSARTTGFYDLYKRVATSVPYTWGQASNGRLGIDAVRLRRLLAKGGNRRVDGLYVPAPVRIDATIITLVAGGWSFHALDTLGRIWHWGQLEGEGWAAEPRDVTGAAAWLESSRMQEVPQLLPVALPPFKSLDCGRSHLLAMDEQHRVYELFAWGRALRVQDRDERWRGGSGIKSIKAGWNYSLVRTKEDRCFVWWRPSEATADAEGEAPRSGIIPDVEVDSIELPRLPVIDNEEEELGQIACGENFLVARSTAGQVYKLSLDLGMGWQGDMAPRRERLGNAFRTGEIGWAYLPLFSDISPASNGVKPRISHVQAHFRHFAALSPAAPLETSAVLLGDIDTTPDSPPRVIPSLQGAGIVQLAMGDYHFGALDDQGVLRTWGSATTGRLGHGVAGQQQGEVDEPTRVDFAGGFAFNIAFAGWHSAALVLRDADQPHPLEREKQEDERDQGELQEPELPTMPGGFPRGGAPPIAPLPGRGLPALRFGYPARGMMRGRGLNFGQGP